MPSKLTARSGLRELGLRIRSGSFFIDHAGYKVDEGDEIVSFSLRVSSDGRSFVVMLRDSTKVTVRVESDFLIAYLEPSVRGTVIRCVLESGECQYFDTRTGARMSIESEELRKRNPCFYQ